MATDVKVIYHYEGGSWWADSPDIERWSAAADDLEALVALVDEGVPFALEQASATIEHLPAPDLMEVFAGHTVGARLTVELLNAFTAMLDPVQVAVPVFMAA